MPRRALALVCLCSLGCGQANGDAPTLGDAGSDARFEPADAENHASDIGGFPSDTGPSDAGPSDAEPNDAEPNDAEPNDAEPNDAEPNDAGTRCRRRVLSSSQAALAQRYDSVYAQIGEAYYERDNVLGELANNEPAIAESMVEMFVASGDPLHLRRLARHADAMLRNRDDLAMPPRPDFTGDAHPVWADRNASYVTGDQPYAFSFESGEITHPIAAFAALVRLEPCLADELTEDGMRMADKADAYIARVAETVAYHHELEWHTATTPSGLVGYYGCDPRVDFAIGLRPGDPVPLNYNAAMGKTMAWMAVATQDASYIERAEALALFMLLELTPVGATDTYTWRYAPHLPWTTGYVPTAAFPEDMAHASLDTDFAALMHERSLGVFYPTELGRLARTVGRVAYDGVTLTAYVDGTGGPASSGYLYQYGRFANLTPYDSIVFERARALLVDTLQVHEPGQWGSAGSLLGLARLVRYAP